MTSRRWDVPSPRVAVPVVVAVLQALLVLGPALGRGVAVTHDMAWSPDPRWTPFVLGLDTPAPRAVPSDAVVVLLGKVVGASLAQHLVLLTILVGLALGACALLDEVVPDVGVLGLSAAAVAAVWNPFVSERLAVGQWAVVLGLATLPWALRAALRVVRHGTSPYAVAPALVCAAVGGGNSLLIVGGTVLAVLLAGAVVARSRRVLRAAGAAAVMCLGLSAAWALPALTASPETDTAGARAFAPVADGPLGVVVSLLAGGGFWNTGSHPEARAQALIALTSALLAMAGVAAVLLVGWFRRGSPGMLLVVPVLVCWVLVLLSLGGPVEGVWEVLVSRVPGGGLLRDSHKLLGVWVVLAATGLGVLTDRAARRVPAGLVGPVVGLLVGLPVVLSLQLVWGIGGRLDAVSVPHDYRVGLTRVASLPPGDVGLLPWSQYRRYAWNENRVSLTLAPRMVDRVVLFDDSLPLRSGTVAGESPRAAAVSERIRDGAAPEQALADERVRYVAAELGGAQEVDTDAVRALGRVVVDGPSLLVVDTGGTTEPTGPRGAVLAGWGVTLLTALVLIGRRAVPEVVRKLPAGLVRSRA